MEKKIEENVKIEKNIIICFDTNIYDATKYLFDGILYNTLKNLKSTSYPNLEIYIEPIIYNEVLQHLRDQAKQNAENIKKLKKTLWTLDIFNNLQSALNIDNLENSCYVEAKKKFDDFINHFSEKGIDETFDYEIAEILTDYFDGSYPDALIIQNLKKKFISHSDLIIVSADAGFLTGIQKKIDKAQTFKSFSDCIDHLNRELKEYQNARQSIENFIPQIEEKIRNKFLDLLGDFVPTSSAKVIEFNIDVTNYDRKNYTNLYKFDEIMINDFDFKSSQVRILDTNDTVNQVISEISFICDITISGFEENSYDLIKEIHRITYKVDVKLDKKSNQIKDISYHSLDLNEGTLRNRDIHRNFRDDPFYLPTLHPTNDSYEIFCDHCGHCNEYYSPSMEEFEIGCNERSMGEEVIYYLNIDEVCENCSETFSIDISISIYP